MTENLKCQFCGNEMRKNGIKSNYLGGIYNVWFCDECKIEDIKPEGFKYEKEVKKMNKQELINEILSDMVYDENIRNGIWKHKTDTYSDFFHHTRGDLLPDDFRYKMIHDIISAMSDFDDFEDIDSLEMLDGLVPVYTHDLISWLSSSNSRYSYCDEFKEQYGDSESIINQISGGYLMELEETYNLILEWLDDNTDE